MLNMNKMENEKSMKNFADIDACPIRNVISRFSGKWAILVMCVLAEEEAVRFNRLGKAIPDVSPKVLTDTLKVLEADGLVNRKVYAEVPPRVEYSLTALGKSLMPHLQGLIGWALTNFDTIIRHREKKG